MLPRLASALPGAAGAGLGAAAPGLRRGARASSCGCLQLLAGLHAPPPVPACCPPAPPTAGGATRLAPAPRSRGAGPPGRRFLPSQARRGAAGASSHAPGRRPRRALFSSRGLAQWHCQRCYDQRRCSRRLTCWWQQHFCRRPGRRSLACGHWRRHHWAAASSRCTHGHCWPCCRCQRPGRRQRCSHPDERRRRRQPGQRRRCSARARGHTWGPVLREHPAPGLSHRQPRLPPRR